MKLNEMKAIVEGLLFVSGDEGIEMRELMNVLQTNEETVKQLLNLLRQDYESDNRGVMIAEVAGVYQLTTKPEHAEYYKRLVESPGASTLSQAALETLAIVAYKQPITRAEIEDIRGVKTERPLQTLTSKLLIKQAGRAEGTGRAILYATTKEFLEYFGLKSIEELPPLPEGTEDKSIEEEADLFFEKFQETLEQSENE